MPLSLFLLASLSSLAQAACPGVFSGQACNPNGTNICAVSGGGWNVECYLSPGPEDDFNTESWYILGSSNTDFKGYGYEADQGDPFCCELTVNDGCAGNPITLVVNGSGRRDAINLVDTVSGHAMDCSTSVIYGEDENDTIRGSNALTNHDFLYGGPNDDNINGREGNDFIDGGGNDDVCFGDPGEDEIHGGTGNDTLIGDPGNDEIYGEAGDDRIKGGNGDDYVEGGDDNDNICGGADIDELYGNAGDDKVTGEAGSDTISRGDADVTNDECEAASADGFTCEIFTVNMTCPW